MSYANVRSFILILLLAAINSKVIFRQKRSSNTGSYGSGSTSSGSNYGTQTAVAAGSNSLGGFTGGLTGYSGLADIGVDMNEFGGNDIGGSNSFGSFSDFGSDIGGTNLWGEFQDIISSVGGIGSSQDIGNIGLTQADFSFGSGTKSSSSNYGGSSNGNSGSSSTYSGRRRRSIVF